MISVLFIKITVYITVVLIFNDTFNFKKYDFKGTTHEPYVIGEKSNPLLTEYICHIIFFFFTFRLSIPEK